MELRKKGKMETGYIQTHIQFKFRSASEMKSIYYMIPMLITAFNMAAILAEESVYQGIGLYLFLNQIKDKLESDNLIKEVELTTSASKFLIYMLWTFPETYEYKDIDEEGRDLISNLMRGLLMPEDPIGAIV